MKQQKVKNPKTELAVVILIGAVMFIAALVVLLVFYRPFVPWVKFVCSEEDGTYLEVNRMDVLYRYKINGVEYEKIIKNVAFTGRGSGTDNFRRTIYVNAKDPSDVKRGIWGGFALGFLIGFIILGLFLIFFLINDYNKKFGRKQIKKEYLYKKKDVKNEKAKSKES